MKNKQHSDKASSSTKHVIRMTKDTTGRGEKCMTYDSGSRRSARIVFRVPFVVKEILRRDVPNVSVFLRRLVLDALERLPVHSEFEELRLELEVARLGEELGNLQRWGSMLLKHGSYAEAYLSEVRGGVVFDRKPYFYSRSPRRPAAKPEEIATVTDLVELREKLSKQLNQVLRRLIEVKRARIVKAPRRRDTQPEKAATKQRRKKKHA